MVYIFVFSEILCGQYLWFVNCKKIKIICTIKYYFYYFSLCLCIGGKTLIDNFIICNGSYASPHASPLRYYGNFDPVVASDSFSKKYNLDCIINFGI